MLGPLLVFALTSPVSKSFADEGLARITELGDRDLVAQSKKAQKEKQSRFKSVEEEEPASDSFHGPLPKQDQNFSAGAGTDYFNGFGVQARYAKRVADKLLPELTNPLYIEGGMGLTFYGTVKDKTTTGVNFTVTGRWDFLLDLNWTFFGDLGFGFNGVTEDRRGDVRGANFFPAIGVGAIGNITETIAIRADLSYQFTGLGVLVRF